MKPVNFGINLNFYFQFNDGRTNKFAVYFCVFC